MIKNNDKSKPYSHPRWNDKQLPVVTGYKELTKEEKERVDRDFKEYCENNGIEIVEDLQREAITMKNDDKKENALYSSLRWNDKQLPVVTGHIEFSEEEKEKSRKEFLDYLRKKGYKV